MRQIDFNDCLVDSPEFRAALRAHEQSLESTNQAVKLVTSAFEDVVKAAENFSQKQRAFAKSLEQLKLFEDDDDVIPSGGKAPQSPEGESFPMAVDDAEREMRGYISVLAYDINVIEDNRDRWLENARLNFLQEMQKYRKDKLQLYKDHKENFKKNTQKYCQSLERYLGTKPAQLGDQAALKDADQQMKKDRTLFKKDAMDYVLKLQIDQEKNKLHFSSTLLALHKVWRCFYLESNGHYESRQAVLQRAEMGISTLDRTLDANSAQATELKEKILATPEHQIQHKSIFSFEGYLMILHKRPVGGGTWSKHFCQYRKDTKMMILTPFNQSNNPVDTKNKETLSVKQCLLKPAGAVGDSERRFVFELYLVEKNVPYFAQAMSEEELNIWKAVLEGKEAPSPTFNVYQAPSEGGGHLNDTTVDFLLKCMTEVEARGLDEEGLYRVEGSKRRVDELLALGTEGSVHLAEWDIRVVSNVIKRYLKQLDEPLFTYDAIDYLRALINKQQDANAENSKKSAQLVVMEQLPGIVETMLPPRNRVILKRLIFHLKNVAANNSVNRMNQSNLAIVFAPTLCWPRFVSLRSISVNTGLGQNVIVVMMDNYEKLFSECNTAAARDNIHDSKAPQIPPHSPVRVPSLLSPGAVSAPMVKQSSAEDEDIEVVMRRSLTSDSPPVSHPRPQFNPNGTGGSYQAPPLVKERIERLNQTTALVSRSNTKYPRRARTRYKCAADLPTELSFEDEQIISILGPSKEPGWLVGRLKDGTEGLVPENYVEMLN